MIEQLSTMRVHGSTRKKESCSRTLGCARHNSRVETKPIIDWFVPGIAQGAILTTTATSTSGYLGDWIISVPGISYTLASGIFTDTTYSNWSR